jgi:3',5'-cyclic AMP phosphodiesterase CpdA
MQQALHATHFGARAGPVEIAAMLRIAVISDTHLTPAASAFNDNFEQAAAWIRASGADLVVHLGDITADGEHQPEQLAAARRMIGRTLGEAVRCLPGNHDLGDRVETTVEHGAIIDRPRIAAFNAAFGADRWRIAADGWILVGLNAQLYGSGLAEEAEQDEWLRGAIPRDAKIGCFLHKPLFRSAPEDGEQHHRYLPAPARRRLLSLLGPNLEFVVSGHVHQSHAMGWGRTAFLWAPSTAFLIPDLLQPVIGEKRLGFLDLQLDGGAFRHAHVRPGGLVDHSLLDHAAIYPEVDRLAAAARARGPIG